MSQEIKVLRALFACVLLLAEKGARLDTESEGLAGNRGKPINTLYLFPSFSLLTDLRNRIFILK